MLGTVKGVDKLKERGINVRMQWFPHIRQYRKDEMPVCYTPLCPGVIALHCVSAGLPLQVPSDGKQEALQHSHTHPAPTVPHLGYDIYHPAVGFWIIALHVAQCLMF